MGNWSWGRLRLVCPYPKPDGIDDVVKGISFEEYDGATADGTDNGDVVLVPGEIFECSGEMVNYGGLPSDIENPLIAMGVPFDLIADSYEGQGVEWYRPGMEKPVWAVSSEGYPMVRVEDVENAIKACAENPGGRSLAEVLVEDVLPPKCVPLEEIAAAISAAIPKDTP